MNALRARMIEDLQLHGLSKSTQLLYVRAVRHLAEYYQRTSRPDHRRRTSPIFSASFKRQACFFQYVTSCFVRDQVLL